MEINAKSTELRTYADRLLCLSLDVAEGMLKSGGEVHRVEDTIERICNAYGAAHVEVFAISTLILASVRLEDGSYSSQIRRVPKSNNDFSCLEDYNRVSREVCMEKPPLEEFDKKIWEVKRRKSYPRWLSVSCGALTSGAFAGLFGGSLRDCLAGFLIGVVLSWLAATQFKRINALAKTIIMSLLAGSLSYVMMLIGLGENLDMIMIGSIMLLIPGLAFGNAMRDLLFGDILAGILKTVQSCLTAIFVAAGFLISILLMEITNVPRGLPALEHPFAVQLLAAVLGTVGFAAMFCVRPKYIPVAVLGGGLTYGAYVLFDGLVATEFLSALLAAIFAALFGELCARILRAPTVLFVTPFTISIVPGGGLYYSMSALLSGNSASLSSSFSSTLLISAGLAAGTMLVTILVGSIKGFLADRATASCRSAENPRV